MSQVARNFTEQAYETRQERRQVSSSQKAVSVTIGEWVTVILCAVILAGLAYFVISNQSALYEMNKNIATVEADIENQQTRNEDLSMQVSELSTYERVWAKAKEQGLELREDNVKVVEGE